ncbi:MAG: secretin N-terminal domain-containing protein [Planctomycetota bacterium]
MMKLSAAGLLIFATLPFQTLYAQAPSPAGPAPRPGNQNPPGNRPAPGAGDVNVPVPPRGPQDKGFSYVDEGDHYVFSFEEPSATPAPDAQLSLLGFIKIFQQMTNTPYYIKKDVLGKLETLKVTLLGSKRVPKTRVLDFFQQILKINEFVLVLDGHPDAGVWVITDLKGPDRIAIRTQARYIPPEEIPNYATQSAVLVATVIAVEHTNAREISASLRPFFPDNQLETVANIGNAQALLVYGFGPTVFSIYNLLKLVDTPPDTPKPIFQVLDVVHTSAEEMSQILDDLVEKRRSTGAATGASGANLQGTQAELKIRVDSRSNSLLIVGLEEDVKPVMEMVAKIDRPQPEPESDFHVYMLKNVKAEELQKTLEDFVNKSFQAQQQQAGSTGGAGRTGGATTGGGGVSRELKPIITAEKVSNALLITANKTRWIEIRDMIDTLDRRQSQVLLETALIELTTTDAIRLGVELGIVDLPSADASKGFGITNFGLSQLIDTDGDNFSDTRIPDNTLQGITGGVISGPDFSIPILIQAIRTVSNSNVLSIPSVLVNNNEHAMVSSKDLVPTGNQTFSGVNGSNNTGFGGYQDAGITLEITPSISAQSYLRLELALKVANFTAAQGANPALPPPKTEREIKTTVYLPNESTMVIGGIQVDNKLESKSSVPILGDIPILSWLFSSHSDSQNRRSLYFFATPHILNDVEFADLQNLSYQKKLDARAYIGDDRIRLVDPAFRPIDPGADPTSGAALESGIFEIPLYRSPKTGEITPSEAGIPIPPTTYPNSNNPGSNNPGAGGPGNEKPKD